jgi:SAM-dependent methyltransferase
VPFEKHRFRTAARHYLSGRPPYATSLIRHVAARVRLSKAEAVLDLGCGPGMLAIAFADLAGRVTAIDPEPEMLRLATAAADEAGAAITFIEGSSYEIGSSLGRFRLCTIGRAFHWMDRADTLRRLDGLLDEHGGVALFSDNHPEVPENAWRKGYDAVLDTYSAEDAARQQRKSAAFGGHEQFLLASPFSALERIGVIERRRTPLSAIEDRILSLSSVSRAQIGDRADTMIGDLREVLAPHLTDGAITEVVESTALLGLRPPAGA